MTSREMGRKSERQNRGIRYNVVLTDLPEHRLLPVLLLHLGISYKQPVGNLVQRHWWNSRTVTEIQSIMLPVVQGTFICLSQQWMPVFR
jgi:hypothetical protein